MMVRVFLMLFVFLLQVGAASAAEVKNAAMRQVGNDVVLEYDLSGKPGEQEADVAVLLEIGGERYGANDLKLSGDYGGKVAIGPGKRIVWDVLAFIPAGFKGDVAWKITVNSAFTDPNVGMQFTPVRRGCYEMGDTFGEGASYDLPVHEVCVNDFVMAKHDVTVGVFRKFVAATRYRTEAETGGGCSVSIGGGNWGYDKSKNWRNPGFNQDDRHPVVCVSWNDAEVFVEWLKKVSGKNYRLPTEAEWEYAARSGGRKEKYSGTSDTKYLHKYANFCDANCEFSWKTRVQNDGHKETAPVGSYQPNGLGLYDMTGNVWQWLQDRYGVNYYKESPRDNPEGPSVGYDRVVRGGSWAFQPSFLTVAGRGKYPPEGADNGVGFRLACTPLSVTVSGKVSVVKAEPAVTAQAVE